MPASDPVRAEDLPAEMRRNAGWESSIVERSERSARLAWVAVALIFVLAVVAIVGVGWWTAPYRNPPVRTVILGVDPVNHTQYVIADQEAPVLTYDDMRDRSWLRRYVMARESYDWNAIQINYDLVAVTSSPSEQRKYFELYDGPNARDKVIADKFALSVDVKSITPNGKGQAVVRFDVKKVGSNRLVEETKARIATIAYEYVKPPSDYKERVMNPDGFQVTSYRADQDAP